MNVKVLLTTIIGIHLSITLPSCVSTTVECEGVKVTHRVIFKEVKHTCIDIQEGVVETTYHDPKLNTQNKALPIVKAVFNWSVLKGIYDLVW